MVNKCLLNEWINEYALYVSHIQIGSYLSIKMHAPIYKYATWNSKKIHTGNYLFIPSLLGDKTCKANAVCIYLPLHDSS